MISCIHEDKCIKILKDYIEAVQKNESKKSTIVEYTPRGQSNWKETWCPTWNFSDFNYRIKDNG